MCVCVRAGARVHRLLRPEGNAASAEAGVKVAFKLPDVGAGNRTQVPDRLFNTEPFVSPAKKQTNKQTKGVLEFSQSTQHEARHGGVFNPSNPETKADGAL